MAFGVSVPIVEVPPTGGVGGGGPGQKPRSSGASGLGRIFEAATDASTSGCRCRPGKLRQRFATTTILLCVAMLIFLFMLQANVSPSSNLPVLAAPVAYRYSDDVNQLYQDPGSAPVAPAGRKLAGSPSMKSKKKKQATSEGDTSTKKPKHRSPKVTSEMKETYKNLQTIIDDRVAVDAVKDKALLTRWIKRTHSNPTVMDLNNVEFDGCVHCSPPAPPQAPPKHPITQSTFGSRT
ncbi:hypothetical protein BIW11_13566 [Tropilaelaps mercedesae]|uniref:Uncharacterized protein n=1 Tax=Tropilaelaps mercedesae TaxID=418985 RepID=A0A1V9X1U6_9ACAR|nr:hypothetical protein BIW11_13566 [Tropilaelaps mercedesae]